MKNDGKQRKKGKIRINTMESMGNVKKEKIRTKGEIVILTGDNIKYMLEKQNYQLVSFG